ncbi:lipocalin-like domain-containing protein [Bradyrhizobium sp. STM 3562]|uniref:lipocalin-like domain-containing protein n=1 Tax=Bradyrhizobium sp. STM 3562 TaxID=578924 RepID=UPI00388DF187
MSAETKLTRRAVASSLGMLALAPQRTLAQGLAGLSSNPKGFAQVTPGKTFSFPADHGPHPDFRIEWWYLTANLADRGGTPYGLQWTLFRHALQPGSQREGWANQQLWMAHAAVTRADTHRFSQTVARGGVGQAGVETEPFRAWIDSWEMRGSDRTDPNTIAPLTLRATAKDFSYALQLETDRPLVLQGDAGYSKKSDREQASYYYSQPFFKVAGRLTIDDKPVDVTGQAWMDREWSSQPLASDQTGWDWFALHLTSGEKLMLYRMRQKDGRDYISGTFVSPAGDKRQLTPADVTMTPKDIVEIDRHRLPVQWQIAIPTLQLAIDTVPLNPRAWMGTSVSYWEGPISFHGTHTGVGYLELTGY